MQRNIKKSTNQPLEENVIKEQSQKDHDSSIVWKIIGPKWGSLVLRFITGILLIATFSLVIKIGPIGLVILVIFIFLRGFHELSRVGYNAFDLHTVPHYKTISYTLLFIFNYFLLGCIIINKFSHIFTKYKSILFLLDYHKLISFNLYTFFFIMFVLMLQKAHYRKQYTLFAYLHMLMLAYVSCYMTIGNILHGSIWFIVPVVLVVFNDIAAYIFGFLFGRTKLIEISPNKTWEGFLGAFVTTLIFGQVISPFMCQYEYFTCPMSSFGCRKSRLFQVEKIDFFEINIFPFQIHAFVFSVYASLIAPFGGFFASGFKRAIGIKDFGNTIPGHGGIIDRFDCHILTNIFVYLYIDSIVLENFKF